jgi:hypothetical protein
VYQSSLEHLPAYPNGRIMRTHIPARRYVGMFDLIRADQENAKVLGLPIQYFGNELRI